jgi:Trp operon repressor
LTQVSKNVLTEKEWILMWNRFLDVFKRSKTRSSLHTIFKGLLTPAEQIMLAKRIVAGLLLLSDWGAYDVAKTLKLSLSSVYKYKGYLEHNKNYQKTLRSLLTKKIPLSELKVDATGSSGLTKLLENIFEGHTRRSKLIYG